MIWKASLVISLALCVSSDRRPAISEQKVERFYSGHHGDLSHIGQHEPEHHEIYAWAYPSYEFSYHVDDPHTHDKKGQHEIRDGDKVTGTYWLLQPDGLKRTVKYRSDHKNGFQAEVNYLPHDGHHYDVREHHDKHGRDEEHREFIDRVVRKEVYPEIHNDWGWRNNDEHNGHEINHRWEQNHRRSTDEDERRDRGRDERRGYNDHRGRVEGPDYRADDKKQEDGNRGEEQNQDRDDNRGRAGFLWGTQSWGKERDDNKDRHRDGLRGGIGGLRNDRGHEEHWKQGVLVGWTEGNGRDDRRSGDNRRGRDNDRGDENKRRPLSYQPPMMNFKPLVPYGQRLH